MLRMQRLRELCKSANRRRFTPNNVCDETLQALEYLQSQVAILVDHSVEEESNQFHQLCAQLCLLPPTSCTPTTSDNTTANNRALAVARSRGKFPFNYSYIYIYAAHIINAYDSYFNTPGKILYIQMKMSHLKNVPSYLRRYWVICQQK